MSKIPRRCWQPWCVLLLLSAGLFVGLRHGDERFTAEPPRETPAVAVQPGASGDEGAKPSPDGVAHTPRRRGGAAAPALFSFVQPPNAAALDRALPAPSPEIHYARVDPALVTGKRSPFWQKPGAGRLRIPLPDGSHVTVAVEHSEMLGPDRFTSVGRIEGRPESCVVFAWNAGFLHASIEAPGEGSFVLRAATEELAQFYRIDPARVPPCGGERRPMRTAAAVSSDLPPGPLALPPVAARENPQAAEVHVMMAYTQAVLPTLAGAARVAALQSAFDLAIAKTNAAFAASLITARVKLVRIAEVHYDENVSSVAKVQDDALTALYQTNDGRMDDVHALRDAAGADVVMLALSRADSASSGLSFLLDTPGDFENAKFAFSVVQYSTVSGTNVVPHELGHVFGCAHDRENALSGPGAYSYSYGYRFFGADGRQYHDIMAYPPGTELSYFSNPDIVLPAPISVPLGIAAGRLGESNSALTIEQNAFATAAYRLQTAAAPAAGTLINVATRAFVGTGDRVLIGGFVVEGVQPKTLLIRAAGPALAPFGVDEPLADPLLHVYAGAVVTAENDDWSRPLNGAAAVVDVMKAANRVRAFPFASGSADAAVLVTLPPGAYSAVVEGARGTTGSGLVEAYEVERGGGRIVNVATRGYATREREMVGGFVVDAAPGATKRVLIRVLGPTLARAPFNFTNVLEDPQMELRNQAGELLIANDDWSSGVDGHARPGPETDFRPLVELYAESQIFATGHAPTNRREPCVLADLPPGAYTVIVRPFELRSSNPDEDQPAVPGVGVLEVYEIGSGNR